YDFRSRRRTLAVKRSCCSSSARALALPIAFRPVTNASERMAIMNTASARATSISISVRPARRWARLGCMTGLLGSGEPGRVSARCLARCFKNHRALTRPGSPKTSSLHRRHPAVALFDHVHDAVLEDDLEPVRPARAVDLDELRDVAHLVHLRVADVDDS